MRSARRRWWAGRLARRLMLALVATAIAASALTALGVNLAIDARFDAYLESQREAREQQVVAALAADYARHGDWRSESLDELAPGMMMSGAEVDVLDQDGRCVWSASETSMGPGMMDMHRDMMGTHREMMDLPELGPTRELRVVVDSEQVGTAVVRVPEAALPAADEEFRDTVNRLLLGAALAAAVLAMTVGVLLARRTTVRVAELTTAADELAAGKRERRAAVSARDEIGELAASFNAVADTVAREDDLRRTFASDIAHELRTPLSVLRGQLEAVRDGVTDPDPEVIGAPHEEALRLSRLVADLEAMADADAAWFTLRPRTVALRP
ncbi:histidine kinase dimerization/phospho-acceptor domain-containing protein [Haloechinothrix sp. LS1_15]|uniref:histidine kinase dimerization/phospho-acceptor domain-containing protein n=1 Tax=Haloechinothrix sp. LS1_15 TaxID=2652248 RepID=UPI00294425AA|nr:histidine kinase dimerization/phospho-acceptor domain-containing protein [Haloechinothrix sp. LS1_15]MDV6011847.1 HAMP domain-containing protein [Haloechinothrix sp. LS1_15]